MRTATAKTRPHTSSESIRLGFLHYCELNRRIRESAIRGRIANLRKSIQTSASELSELEAVLSGRNGGAAWKRNASW